MHHQQVAVALLLLHSLSALLFADAFAIDAQLNAIPDTIAYPAAFAASFRTGAAISVINQPHMPPIDNGVQVGSTVMRLPSGARMRLFYPANSTAAVAATDGATTMSPYCTNGRQTSNGMSALVGFEPVGLSFLLGHLADACSGCIEDAPMKLNTNTDTFQQNESETNENKNDNQLPLLIYSHGYGGNMDMATYLFRTMASKGVIVAAMEHTDGTASSTVLEDGSERRFNEYYMTGRQQLIRRSSELLEAAEFLPKELDKKYNTTNLVGTIMFGGHSYGGAAAVMASNGASNGTDISGTILHDPALGMGYGMLPPNGAKSRIPTITYVSDGYNRERVRYGDMTLHVKGAFHGNFVDAPLWAPKLVMRALSAVIPAAGPSDPVKVHSQLAESANEFLKNKDPTSQNVMTGDLFERVQ